MRIAPQAAVLVLFAVLATLFGFAGCKKGTAIESLEPATGNVSGNDDVTIHGRGFVAGMTVHFGKRAVSSVVVDSPTRIRVKTPPGSEGKVDVILTDESGKGYVLKEGFAYRRNVSR